MVNESSQESINQYFIIERKIKHPYQGWVAINQETSQKIATNQELKKNDYRVLLYLLGSVEYENWLTLSQAKIANALEMKRSNVNASLKKLQEQGIIEKHGRANYRLSPQYGYKGKAKNLKKEVKL